MSAIFHYDLCRRKVAEWLMNMKFLILNGPNLNLLGRREPKIYGKESYKALEDFLHEKCATLGITCDIRQSNHEGDLVDWIQQAMDTFDGIILNPAAYTHTSIAIPDALRAVQLPCIEVHLSNIDERESYRRISYCSEVCLTTCKGNGFESYADAIAYLYYYLSKSK